MEYLAPRNHVPQLGTIVCLCRVPPFFYCHSDVPSVIHEWHMTELDDTMTDETLDQGLGDGHASRTPPYISFATLLTFLKALKTDGVPPQIDKSVLSKLSGGVQGQMKLALRSLGLMEGDKPTDQMQALVDAYETPGFEAALRERLKATYPYVFALDLMTATPTMLADAFKVTGAKEDVLRKCRTFFLHAAKAAGVPLGTRIATGSVPRTPNGGARKKPKTAKLKEPGQEQAATARQEHAAPISDKALEYKLVDLLKEPDLGDDERPAIWTLIQYLARREKNKATGQK
jgi:hypothetical protein